MVKFLYLIFFCFISFSSNAQNELTNWYFGYGTDGIRFVNGVPQKLSDKAFKVGFEGMIVVNDPLTGDLLFYSDGDKVIDKNHNTMSNGTGMTGHYSGSQCVQSCPVPGSCATKFYLFTNSSWDFTPGKISYSIVDFTSNPLGTVTNKNTLFWNGPSDEGMCLVNKPGTNDFWLIANEYATAKYNVWPLTAAGIGAPVSYTFSNTGESYQIKFDKVSQKLTVTGWVNKHVTVIDFNPATGVMSNEVQLAASFGDCFATMFSPDGTKLYAGLTPIGATAPTLYQYDFATAVWNNMNTCCYAHDLKIGPDGKMYHIHTYYDNQPIAVIDFPNKTAIGNACNYHKITFTPAFNGEVRRFPETVVLPLPPVANIDSVDVSNAAVDVPVLLNDFDPKGDAVSLDAVVSTALYGTAIKSGSNIRYTPNQNVCGKTDTLIYRIKDGNCGTDTAKVLLKFATCTSNPQFCSGSKGFPIVNITFGSGTNPGPKLPDVAPGAFTTYTYVQGIPLDAAYHGIPLDGEYTITNSVPAYPNWLQNEPDHTGDPNGYMAFFNSDPNPGGEFYRQTVNNLCAGTTYEFSTWIANVIKPSMVPNSVSPNITFKILDALTQTVLASSNTGDIPVSNTNNLVWNQYGLLFVTPMGINSVILVLSNNNVGGTIQSGNDLVMDDINFRACGPLTNASFSASVQSDSIAVNACTAVDIFGKITGSFNNPSYQWQISSNGGNTFTDLPNGTSLNTTISSLNNGLYQIQLLSAEAGNIGSPTCSFISNKIKLLVTGCPASLQCNNWLNIPNSQSYVTVGEIDIPGQKITVEGLFSRDSAFTPEGYTSLNVVSKHWTPADANYLLRVDRAEITTSNGYFATPDICTLENKKIYHAAMTYDGSMLKFYRNGFLMSQTPCTGDMFQNNYLTTIGATANSPTTNTQLIGYLNEIRIWNVVKTQAELQASMNGPLSNPQSQTGLLGYYTFDNLLNKQGNAAYDAVLHGAAAINKTVPNCVYQFDSCLTVPPVNGISSIINDYTPVVAFNPCDNKITVKDAAKFNAGDTVMIIQMKGAVIDSSNTVSFGTITNYRNAGNYELNYVKGKAGNVIELKNVITKQYDVPVGKVQLIRVPYFKSAVIADTLTCLPWDGEKGGVLVLNAKDTVTLNAHIDVSGKGFFGGRSKNSFVSTLSCFFNDYSYPDNTNESAAKGESIFQNGPGIAYGKGPNASGGGSGNGHNSGGGGGANAGAGGFGGYQLEACGNAPFDNRGLGGKPSLLNNRIYLGGGGGSGHTDNQNGIDMNGGNGGGIAFVIAGTVISNGFNISAKGSAAPNCDNNLNNCHDGSGGGGGGGTIVIDCSNIKDPLSTDLSGGKGGDLVLYNTNGAGRIGPGGGGGGGLLAITQTAPDPKIIFNSTGGPNGVIFQDNNSSWGATPGSNGAYQANHVVTVDGMLFKPNIDSVRITNTPTSCNKFNFNGLGFINRDGIQTWQWSFGDGGTASSQNTSHTYTADGNFNVKLVATDINGCKDSISISVRVQNCLSSSRIINDYTPALAFNSCNNKLTVKDASSFKTGDTVLLIQMKGAAIDDRNLSSFGDISDYKNAGNYEFNYIKNKAGNIIELKNVLTKKYDIPDGKVQLIRVPWFQSITISDTLTCLPWDGEKGGVVVLNAANTVTLNAPIDATSKGFRGGGAGTGFRCGQPDWAVSSAIGGIKGEGITEYIPGEEAGGAKSANGGGGGFGGNAGGSGGGNYGAGAIGGKEYNLCFGTLNQGSGGLALDYSTNTKVFLGGGGGGGQQDNGQLVLPGGRGGGLIIVKAGTLNSNNQKITANGETFSIIIKDEGGNGGGAGGSILMDVNTFSGNLQVQADGGSGSSNNNVIFAADCHGPGGGGGGGYIAFSKTALPAGVTSSFTGGAPGMVLNPVSACFNSTYGAEKGASGGMKFNVPLPQDGTVFKTNIDSVRFKDSATVCRSFDFKGAAFIQRDAIRNWDWNFADGGTGLTQNVSHTYLLQGNYTVKLIATDINGCKDSIAKQVTVVLPVITAGTDKRICRGKQVQLSASGAASYKWQPATGLNDDAVANPIASPADTTQYIVTGTVSTGCTVNDTVIVFIIPSPVVIKTNDTLICEGKPVQLFVSGADSYVWSPASTLNNANIPNPVASPLVNTTYYVQSTSAAFSCTSTDSVKVSLKKPGVFSVAPGGSVCTNKAVQLIASGGDEYLWSPAGLVSNPLAGSTRATVTQTTNFTVKIKDLVCNDSAILNTTVVAIPLPELTVTKSNDVDCFTDTVQLNVTGADQYLWTSPQSPLYLNDATSPNPIAYLINAKTYYVTGTSATTGCSNKDTINIVALENANKPFYAPNAFSPNGDGHNDCYKIFANGLLKGFEMAIYNRYGELVFTTSNPTDCWDGRYKGKLQNPGNYVVYIRAINKCVRGVTKSNLVLVR